MITPAKRGRDKEKQDIKRLSMDSQINSGTFWFSKGDAVLEYFLVDSKSHAKDSIRFLLKQFLKLKKWAAKEGKHPLFIVGLGEYSMVTKENKYSFAIFEEGSLDIEVVYDKTATGGFYLDDNLFKYLDGIKDSSVVFQIKDKDGKDYRIAVSTEETFINCMEENNV